MEYLTTVNIVTAVIILVMLHCLRRLFTGDIGRNKALYVLVFVSLGIALYIWRSGAAADIMTHVRGFLK